MWENPIAGASFYQATTKQPHRKGPAVQATADEEPICRICGRLIEMGDRPAGARSSHIGHWRHVDSESANGAELDHEALR